MILNYINFLILFNINIYYLFKLNKIKFKLN